MEGLRSTMRELAELDPQRTAIIPIHWQNDVVMPGGAFGDIFAKAVADSGVISRTAEVVNAARKNGCLIIHVRVAYQPGFRGHIENNALFRRAASSKGFVVGTPGAEIIPALRPHDGDLVIDHTRSSAFFGTDLLTLLIGHGITTIGLSGIATNVAVDHTARDAMQYGYNTILLDDCCFSSDMEHHRAALVTLRVLCTAVMTSGDFMQLLRNARLSGR